MGKVNSAPPGVHGGNLDNKELVAGTILYLPVHAKGALLEVGDGHAGMGNGEIDITAMETSLTGVFQLIVRKDMHLTWPRAETPTHWITMGLDPDLTQAARICGLETIDFLVTQKTDVARRRLSAIERRRGFRYHAIGRWNQRRARHDPEKHLQVTWRRPLAC